MPNAKDTKEPNTRRIFAVGGVGSGKSTQIITLPRPCFVYAFDASSPLAIRGYDIEYQEFLPGLVPFHVAPTKSADKGGKKDSSSLSNKESDVFKLWEADLTEKAESGYFDNFETICIDSATTLLDLIMDRMLTLQGRPGQWPQQDDYGPQMISFQNAVRSIISLGKHVYMTGHLTEPKQDEKTKRMVWEQPMMSGRLKTKIPMLFTDVFHCMVEIPDPSKSPVHKIQTVNDTHLNWIRTSIRGLSPFEDVTIDFNEDVQTQGIGGLIRWAEKNRGT